MIFGESMDIARGFKGEMLYWLHPSTKPEYKKTRKAPRRRLALAELSTVEEDSGDPRNIPANSADLETCTASYIRRATELLYRATDQQLKELRDRFLEYMCAGGHKDDENLQTRVTDRIYSRGYLDEMDEILDKCMFSSIGDFVIACTTKSGRDNPILEELTGISRRRPRRYKDSIGELNDAFKQLLIHQSSPNSYIRELHANAVPSIGACFNFVNYVLANLDDMADPQTDSGIYQLLNRTARMAKVLRPRPRIMCIRPGWSDYPDARGRNSERDEEDKYEPNSDVPPPLRRPWSHNKRRQIANRYSANQCKESQEICWRAAHLTLTKMSSHSDTGWGATLGPDDAERLLQLGLVVIEDQRIKMNRHIKYRIDARRLYERLPAY